MGYWTQTQLPSWAPCLSERPDSREGSCRRPAHGRDESPLQPSALAKERELLLWGKVGARRALGGGRGCL